VFAPLVSLDHDVVARGCRQRRWLTARSKASAPWRRRPGTGGL